MAETMTTLTGAEYSAPEIFDIEQESIFRRVWQCVGREESLPSPGACRVLEVGEQSVLLVRGRDGELYAHHNVCRHRGARLCADGTTRIKGAIRCPYHAWSYAHDGRLIGTPNVEEHDVDRASLSLWPVRVDVWQGFVFVALGDHEPPLEAWLETQEFPKGLLERHHAGDLRIGRTTVSDVAANWKILIENYNECLHCPTVHPELVALIPQYRTGAVGDRKRPDGGVVLSHGGTSFTMTGMAPIRLLPEMTDATASIYHGGVVFPNLFVDLTGTSLIITYLRAIDASRTRIVTEYLFHPDEVAHPGFDPSPVVDFSELVARQDYDVCEGVQQGVSSRVFDHGVLAPKDALLAEFHARYRRQRDGS